jgi:hypothetical protein
MIRKLLAKLSAIKRAFADRRFGAFLDRLWLKFFPGKFADGELSESLLPKRRGLENKLPESTFSENKFSGIKLPKSKRSVGKTSENKALKWRFL